MAQRAERGTGRIGANRCDGEAVRQEALHTQPKTPKPCNNADLGVIVRVGAMTGEQAGPLGFEPRLTEPESVVLPLH